MFVPRSGTLAALMQQYGMQQAQTNASPTGVQHLPTPVPNAPVQQPPMQRGGALANLGVFHNPHSAFRASYR